MSLFATRDPRYKRRNLRTPRDKGIRLVYKIVIEPKFIPKKEINVYWSGKHRKYIILVDDSTIELTPKQYDVVVNFLKLLLQRKEKEKRKEEEREEQKHTEFCFVTYGNIDIILFLLAKKIGKDKVDKLLYELVEKMIKRIGLKKLEEFCKKANELLRHCGNIGGYCISLPYSTKLEEILNKLHKKIIYVTPTDLSLTAILLNIEKFSIPENEDLIEPLLHLKEELLSSRKVHSVSS